MGFAMETKRERGKIRIRRRIRRRRGGGGGERKKRRVERGSWNGIIGKWVKRRERSSGSRSRSSQHFPFAAPLANGERSDRETKILREALK